MFLRFILNKRLSYVFFILISYLVVHKSIKEQKKNDLTSIFTYTYDIYEYQQIQRYFKFDGDFSFKNRVTQAIYEYKGNHVSGLYNSVIILFSPKLLINDYDIFIRSIVAVLAICFSFNLIFRTRYYAIWILLLLFTFFQFPILFNIRIGLVSYTPEFIGTIYLMSGYLFLFYFFQVRHFGYLILGLTLFFAPISFSLNFFAYCGLLSIPFLILFIRNKMFFTRSQLIILLFVLTFYFLFFGYYVFIHFSEFYGYYNTISYAIGDINQSFKFLLGNFSDFFSWYFFLFFPILAYLGNNWFILPNYKNIILNKLDSIILFYPLMIYFVFVILIMNSMNTTHIKSVLFLFSLLLFPLLKFNFFIQKKAITYLQVKRLVLSFLLIFISIYIYVQPISVPSTYTNTTKTQLFLINYLKQNKILSMLNCFDSIVSISINHAICNEENITEPFNLAFFTNNVYLKYTCKSFDTCLKGYIHKVDKIDLILINEHENDPNINPISKRIKNIIRKKLKYSSSHKLVMKKYFPYHGNILFYRMK
jgi:hypothetical protein